MRSNLARGTLLGFAAQAWHLLAAFLLYAYLARELGPADFGQWRLALSVLVWFEIFLNSGLTKVTTKSFTQGEHDRADVSRAGLTGQMIVAIAAFVALEASAGLIARALGEPSVAVLLRVAAFDIPVYGLFMIWSAMQLGRHHYTRQAIAWMVYATAKFAAIGGLVAAGFEVKGALIGNAVASVVGLVFVAVPLGVAQLDRAGRGRLLKGMAIAAVPFLSLNLIEGFGRSADLWLLSALVPVAAQLGWYASASALAEIPTFLFEGLNRVLFPGVSQARADGDTRLVGRYALQGVRLATMVGVLGIAMMAATGKEALTFLYSSAYVGAYWALVVLMAAGLGRSLRATATEVLMARDQRAAAVTLLVVAIGIELVLLWALTGRFGLVGAASATAVAALIAGVSAVIALRDLYGFRPLFTFVRSAVAAAVVAAGVAWVGPSGWWLLVAYPVCAIAYVVLLGLMREIADEDISSVLTALGR